MVDWQKARKTLFSVFYSSSFTVVFGLIISFVVLSPADSVYQAYRAQRWIDIIMTAGAYILTGILAILLYASRLYTNRSVLKDIPKTYLPVEKEDLPGKRVRALIEDRLTRSAVTAYLAKPRASRVEEDSISARGRMSELIQSNVPSRGQEPSWGKFEHPGYSSAEISDLPPSLQFESVVKELPDLIEARAVSLAPLDPSAALGSDGAVMPDEGIIEILQRPAGVGMREYFGQLVNLGTIEDNDLAKAFLAAYERARFAANPLTEAEFRTLMNMFADVLRAMSEIDPGVLPELSEGGEEDNVQAHDQSSGASTFSNEGSVRHRPDRRRRRRTSQNSGPSVHSEDGDDDRPLRTAPLMVVRSTSRPRLSPRMLSANSAHSLRQTRSNQSQRSQVSVRSEGSVLRLAGPTDPLPYTISVPQVDR